VSTTTTRRGAWACPDAVQTLPADAPRDAWLAERRRGIGGSDASTIAGVNRWSSRYELWLDKTGRLPERPETVEMRMGRVLEPVVRELFTEETGIPVRRAGLMVSRTHPWQRVSVDGLTADGGLFEAKTTNWRMAEEWDDDQVADHAEVQVQHALAVTGRSHAWVAVLIDGRRFEFRRVERDEHLILVLTGMEERFWTEHVLADVAPPMEPNALEVVKDQYRTVELDAVEATDAARVRDILARRAAGKAMEKAGQQQAATAEAELVALIGAAEALTVDGHPVATRKQITAHRLNGKALAADHPDLVEQYTRPAPYRRLHIVKEK
jgi:putative phage-type endonuclease